MQLVVWWEVFVNKKKKKFPTFVVTIFTIGGGGGANQDTCLFALSELPFFWKKNYFYSKKVEHPWKPIYSYDKEN